MDSRNHKLLPSTDFSYSHYFHHVHQAGHMGPANSGHPRLGGPSYQWVNGYHRHPTGMHEEIWRQMEKEKIRAEIIAEENARHILEAEVRREFMIQRDLAMQRSDGSIYTSRLTSVNVHPTGFPALASPQKVDGIPLGKLSGFPTLVRHEFGSLETSSQTGATPRSSEFMPSSDAVKEKEKVILLAKPEAKVTSLKRKADVLMPSVSVSKPTSAGACLKNKLKEEWSCALCQVSATSEQGLNEHLQGKRHKAKEAGLRKNGKNCSIGLFPKKILMPNKLLEIHSSPCIQKGVKISESQKTLAVIPAEANEENTETKNNPVILRTRQLEQTVKKNKAPNCRTESKTREKKFKFWCERCQKGAFSEHVMEAHRKGKKHLALMLEKDTVGKPQHPHPNL